MSVKRALNPHDGRWRAFLRESRLGIEGGGERSQVGRGPAGAATSTDRCRTGRRRRLLWARRSVTRSRALRHRRAALGGHGRRRLERGRSLHDRRRGWCRSRRREARGRAWRDAPDGAEAGPRRDRKGRRRQQGCQRDAKANRPPQERPAPAAPGRRGPRRSGGHGGWTRARAARLQHLGDLVDGLHAAGASRVLLQQAQVGRRKRVQVQSRS